jgi:hypothetical protein
MIGRVIESPPKKSRRNTSRVVLDDVDHDREDDFDFVNVDQPSGDAERYSLFWAWALLATSFSHR